MPDLEANERKAATTITKARKYGYSLAYGKACKAYGLANALAHKYGYKGESVPGSKRTEREILADYVTSIIYERPLENDVEEFKEELTNLKKEYDKGFVEYKIKRNKKDTKSRPNFNLALSIIAKDLEELGVEESKKVSIVNEVSNILKSSLN